MAPVIIHLWLRAKKSKNRFSECGFGPSQRLFPNKKQTQGFNSLTVLLEVQFVQVIWVALPPSKRDMNCDVTKFFEIIFVIANESHDRELPPYIHSYHEKISLPFGHQSGNHSIIYFNIFGKEIFLRFLSMPHVYVLSCQSFFSLSLCFFIFLLKLGSLAND